MRSILLFAPLVRLVRVAIAPHRAIAGTLNSLLTEITLLRELFELQLASQNPPIMRLTEAPRKDDTEVSNMNDAESDVPKWKRGWAPVDDDDL